MLLWPYGITRPFQVPHMDLLFTKSIPQILIQNNSTKGRTLEAKT